MTNNFCEAAAEWDHDWDAQDVCRECGIGGVVVEEIEMFEGVVYVNACHCADRYPQVDAYRADVHNDDSVVLICDRCNDEGAMDI